MRTFGTLALGKDGSTWWIRVEPHVAVRLKRVFPKLDANLVGVQRLANTPENARDLEWFLQRYPLAMDESDAAALRSRSDEHREREALIAQLLSSEVPAMACDMALPPREYQKQAAAIVRASGSLLLADDVGLGKSVSAIAAFVEPQLQPVLVVTLAHLPPQWRGFVERFAPHLRVHILKRGDPYDIRDTAGRLPHVILSSYHKLRGWAETLGPIVKSVVWDECQELRHRQTAKYNAAEFLANAVPYRMGLSATPIYNYGAEMFNVLECISPGQLGSRSEFMTEWCGHCDESVRDPQAFGSYLRENGLMLRRTRKDVGRELPACQSIVQPIEVDLHALERMQANCAELAKIILGTGEAFKGQKMKAAAELDWRLRQATGIAKAPYTAAFARMLVESGEKVLLYGWHREVYGIWLKQLEDLNPTLYTGSESANQKEFSKQRFLSGDAKVMCISLRSGAGLDGLQDVCSTVIFGELDWSPGVHEQNIGRVFRDGQQRPVFAYYLLADQGSDPVIADVLGIKTQQIDGLRDPERELVERLEVDPNHIKKLAESYLKHHGRRKDESAAAVSGAGASQPHVS